jgi:hypothetical protein
MLDWCCNSKKPCIFMPRWASRIWLQVTSVRAQFIQDICEEDAKAEGADDAFLNGASPLYWQGGKSYIDERHPYFDRALALKGHRGGFAQIWDKINRKHGGWWANQSVWAYEFERVPDYKPPVS